MPTYQVVMSKGPTPGKFFNLSGSNVTIGRDINADIVINIPEVSRRHAQFRLEGGSYILEDLGSTNGTFVNGQRLTTPHRMRDGETIMLGEAVVLMFRTSGPPDPNATIVESSSQVATMLVDDQVDFPSADPADMYAPDQYQAPPPPAYAGQVPPGPMDYGAERTSDGGPSRTWLYAGIGCLLIILIGCVGVAVLFDTMDMYCQPPFDSLFSFLYTCP
jgi:pSer/pThr/pTyr-binding forkhead associated (FHA) protein